MSVVLLPTPIAPYTIYLLEFLPPPSKFLISVSGGLHTFTGSSLSPLQTSYLSSLQCIAAGSHILNHELESEQLRPFALQLSKAISRVRVAIKEQCLTNRQTYTQKVGYLFIIKTPLISIS